MGFMHIENLYKNQKILEFEEIFSSEKLHGTSAHIGWAKEKGLWFFSGGEKHENFVQLFVQEKLKTLFESLGVEEIIVYGEAYGGKQQGMRATYGDELKFCAFDVKMNHLWLDQATANTLVTQYLKLDFIPFKRIPATLEAINEARDADSEVAIRNGMGEGKKREGVVLRPIRECVDERGNRIIAKHKREEFSEVRTHREVDPEKQKIWKESQAIAKEFVTPMRLQHLLDQAQSLLNAAQGLEGPRDLDLSDTGIIVRMMVDDVKREAKGEIVESVEANKAIGREAALLYKKWLSEKLKEKYIEK